MLVAPLKFRSNTAPLVGGLVILVLAAIAMALPPAPITTQGGTGGLGTIESTGLFGSGLAELNAAAGYGYLTLDLSAVNLSKNSFWREELDVVAQRRFSVWGWIDTTRAKEQPEDLISSSPVLTSMDLTPSPWRKHAGVFRVAGPSFRSWVRMPRVRPREVTQRSSTWTLGSIRKGRSAIRSSSRISWTRRRS